MVPARVLQTYLKILLSIVYTLAILFSYVYLQSTRSGRVVVPEHWNVTPMTWPKIRSQLLGWDEHALGPEKALENNEYCGAVKA